MEFPDDVLRILEGAAREYAEDIDKATEEAEKEVRRLPDFDEFCGQLISGAIREGIHSVRHRDNCRIRKEAGGYGGGAKVRHDSPAVGRALGSVYLYFIAGRTLGQVRGADLPGIAESERSVAAGHTFNAMLCERLAPLVPEEKTVEQCVPEKRLRRLFAELQGGLSEPQKAAARVNGSVGK